MTAAVVNYETMSTKAALESPTEITPYVPTESAATKDARPGIILESSRVVLNILHDDDETNEQCYVGHDEEGFEVMTFVLGSTSGAPSDNAWSEVLNEDRLIVAQWQNMRPVRPSRRARRSTTVYGHSRDKPIGTVINNRKFALSDELAKEEESFWMGPISSNVYMGVSESIGKDSPNFDSVDQTCITQYTPVGSNGTPGGACFYHDNDVVRRVELELPVEEDYVSDERRLAFVALVAYQVGQFNAQLQVLKASTGTQRQA